MPKTSNMRGKLSHFSSENTAVCFVFILNMQSQQYLANKQTNCKTNGTLTTMVQPLPHWQKNKQTKKKKKKNRLAYTS